MDGHDPDADRRRRRLAGVALVVIVVVFAVGWYLTQALYSNARLEDCVLSGRTNCAPIEGPPR